MKSGSASALVPVMTLEGEEGVEEEYFFEGTEKLLEIWFAASPCTAARARAAGVSGDIVPDLRRIDR